MDYGCARTHRPLAELEHARESWPTGLRTEGKVELIVLRPQPLQRRCPLFAELHPEHGLIGDRWSAATRTEKAQVTLMDVRAASAMAERADWALFGDNLIVDLDIDMNALKPGRVLGVGSARVMITDEPHLGCKKLGARFGADVLAWVNDKARRELRLRGVHAQVITAGTVHLGDLARVE